MWLPGVLRQERRRRVRADWLSGFVIRRRILGGSEVDRGDAALRHRGGRADSDPGRERGDGRRAGAPISCSIPAHASSRSCSNILAGTDLRPRLRKLCCANASCRSRPALIMRRGRSCGRCGETGWRSCRRARRSGGSCPDRARDRGAPAEPAEIGDQPVHLRSAQSPGSSHHAPGHATRCEACWCSCPGSTTPASSMRSTRPQIRLHSVGLGQSQQIAKRR